MCRGAAPGDGDSNCTFFQGISKYLLIVWRNLWTQIICFSEELWTGKSWVSAPGAYPAHPSTAFHSGWVQQQSISPVGERLSGNKHLNPSCLMLSLPLEVCRSCLWISGNQAREETWTWGSSSQQCSYIAAKEVSPQYPHFSVNNCLLLWPASSVAHRTLNNRGK